MKSNELIIGDWVKFMDEPLKVQYVYNNGYDDIVAETMEEFLDEDGVICEEIKDVPLINCSPIPLTPEILEKNGWKEAEYWHEYQDGGNIIQCCLPDMRGRINGIEIENFKCEYVHQYQHLLRLCGLNELADNFKI